MRLAAIIVCVAGSLERIMKIVTISDGNNICKGFTCAVRRMFVPETSFPNAGLRKRDIYNNNYSSTGELSQRRRLMEEATLQ